MNGVFRRISVLLCLVLFVGVVPAGAQVSTGEINGKVSDGTGATLPGVTVTLTSAALIQPLSTVSAESGAYGARLFHIRGRYGVDLSFGCAGQ